jgi:outer membrane beta-barrel protein
MKRLQILIATFILASAHQAWAQSDENEDLNVIEVELERGSQPAPPEPESIRAEKREAAAPEPRHMDFSGLGALAPFTEVSVIQKRYLPKTGRFQLFGGLTLITNDPFFNTIGGVVKGGYFFTESMGVELNYFGLSTSEAKATQELKKIQGVQTDNLILTKGFLALDFMMVPIYGKMAWFNEKIVPFDLYFSLGYGSTQTQSESAGTFHLATGQIFALSKATAFRWDFSWNFFSATGVDQQKSGYNNLFLTVGWSWFFPEAKYR